MSKEYVLPIWVEYLIFVLCIVFIIISIINISMYAIARGDKNANPPVSVSTANLLIIMNSVILALSVIGMIYLCYRLFSVHGRTDNSASTELTDMNKRIHTPDSLSDCNGLIAANNKTCVENYDRRKKAGLI